MIRPEERVKVEKEKKLDRIAELGKYIETYKWAQRLVSMPEWKDGLKAEIERQLDNVRKQSDTVKSFWEIDPTDQKAQLTSSYIRWMEDSLRWFGGFVAALKVMVTVVEGREESVLKAIDELNSLRKEVEPDETK